MSRSGRSPQSQALHDVDVAVVGGGPGGGMAACTLAATGLDVVLLEKRKLPRPKACGGAMPGSVLRDLDWCMDHLVEARVRDQIFRYDHSTESRASVLSDPMILVDRAAFDQAMVMRALTMPGSKVRLREGWEVTAAEEDDHGVTLRDRTGAQVRCRYVIAADGATSRVARDCALYTRAQGAAVDAHVVVTPDTFDTERDRVTFNIHCVEHGYGWVFPKSDHLSCGVGMWREPHRLLPQLDAFLARSFPAGSIIDMTRLSHPVPVFQGHRPIATRRVCLVGDAAHMVDPVLGEGIRYAFEAGRLAAAVVTHLCRPETTDGGQPTIPTGTSDDFATLSRRYGDCRIYDVIARHTIARRLNLIRLRDAGFFDTPSAVYQSVMN